MVTGAGKTSRVGALRRINTPRNVNTRVFGSALNELDPQNRTDGYSYYSQRGSHYTPTDEAAS